MISSVLLTSVGTGSSHVFVSQYGLQSSGSTCSLSRPYSFCTTNILSLILMSKTQFFPKPSQLQQQDFEAVGQLEGLSKNISFPQLKLYDPSASWRAADPQILPSMEWHACSFLEQSRLAAAEAYDSSKRLEGPAAIDGQQRSTSSYVCPHHSANIPDEAQSYSLMYAVRTCWTWLQKVDTRFVFSMLVFSSTHCSSYNHGWVPKRIVSKC